VFFMCASPSGVCACSTIKDSQTGFSSIISSRPSEDGFRDPNRIPVDVSAKVDRRIDFRDLKDWRELRVAKNELA
jgi:hypothetical protein